MKTYLVIIVWALSAMTMSLADESTATTPAESVSANSVQSPAGAEQTESAMPERWLFICCGLPGDDEHRERLTSACTQLATAAESVLGVSAQHVRLLAGDEQMQNDLQAVATNVGVCAKETVQTMMADLCQQVPDDGSCWVILLGHAHLYGSKSQFNILDVDFDQNDFGEWAKPLQCREQVFLITLPVSGFWTKPLRHSLRVVITATEADLEYTGTEMPYALADILAGDGEHAALKDVDADGSLTLLDLYLATNLEIHGRFTALERLQTEHASLDDNGDGRGSEVQLPYLPVKKNDTEADNPDNAEANSTEELKAVLPKPISNQNLDGYRSRQILLRRE